MSLRESFRRRFGREGQAEFAAPGRVNLIGEHIDYCGGLVMPMAIDRGTRAVVARNDDGVLRVYSERFDALQEVPLQPGARTGEWTDFPIGVVSLLLRDYKLSGVDLYVSSDIGAGGLSSSASFSLLISNVLIWAAGYSANTTQQRLDLARLCQQVEHDFVGVNCGIMDQASIALGGIMMLDCGSLEFEPMPEDFGEHALIVMDTCHSRTLAGSKYNERVTELAEIKRQLSSAFTVEHLCDVTVAELDEACAMLSNETLQRRLRHVVSENDRVQQAAIALQGRDFVLLGELMNKSHNSLQQDYEVTGSALDTIVAISRAQMGSMGARMTGAGFGGCALALVKKSHLIDHNAAVAAEFAQKTGVVPNLFAVAPAKAAGER